MEKKIYVKPDLWIVTPREELMINPAKGSWRVFKGDDFDGWFNVYDEDEWDDDEDYKGANDSFFDD